MEDPAPRGGSPTALRHADKRELTRNIFGLVNPQVAPGQSTSMDFVLDSMAAGFLVWKRRAS